MSAAPRRLGAGHLLALAVVAGLALRLLTLSGKFTIDHDEAISYLAATCHQGSYDEVATAHLYPFASWAPAAAWQAFLLPDDAWCFGRIATDLAAVDIHPPLYFWLLHVSVLALGVHTWTGPVVNLVLYLAGALALFGLARRVLGGGREAALVVAVWALSPAVVRIFAEARQYELFALVTILFAWQAIRVAEMDRPPRAQLALLALAVLAGALTHYHFAIVAAAGAILIVRRRMRQRARSAVAPLLAMAAGYLAFAVLHPGIWESFGRQQEQAPNFAAEGLGARLDRTASALVGFLFPEGLLAPAVAYALLAALGVAAAWLRRRHRGRPAVGAGAVALFLGWIGGVTVLLYLTFVSHGYAMGGKYLAAAWPFAAFVPVLALRRVGAPRRAAVAGSFLAVLAVSGAVGGFLFYRGAARPRDPAALLAGSRPIVVDTVRRGILPPIAYHLEPRTAVFAAGQDWLLAHPSPWIDRLGAPWLFVSDDRYGNRLFQRRLLDLLRRRHAVHDARRSIWGAGHVFLVRDRAAADRKAPAVVATGRSERSASP